MNKIIFLGTSAGVPTRNRNVSALALQPENSKAWMLFDCGEGTQHQLLKTSLSAYNLSRIFITHLHGDHVYGLCGLLASKGMQRAEMPLEIYGPPGIKEMLETVMKFSQLNLPFDLKIFEISKDTTMRFEGMRIVVVELSHSITSYGFVVIFDDTPGRFDIEKAKALGIPEGPLYSKLKRGETVKLPDGRSIDGRDLVGVPKKGRRIAIGGDNDDPLLFSPFAPYDLMIHEATYTQYDFDHLPRKFKHTTAKQLAEAAQKMGVEWLILNHISPRYDKKGRVSELVEEAKRHFDGNVEVAYDFMQIEI
ncbi:ribonuclease Z [Hydrogenimonas cancrithermarum]|uniref:Ribonuclease Z n=1 Tax=Hydrogenimonas cancrithermarum TaxID=2993563 RepID=A0ABN6WT29_9BACT|nr:ribonuclease Z [Hydrogenimonas cancrithermarum]BDY12038.1 ribonuclease Z [Hydrogenimonas cancrithermarum]